MTIINSVIAGGGSPVIEELNVTPTTSAQTITAPTGTDGYSPVKVAAVTSAIDANITAGNIKSGVSILGVSGNVVELNGTTASVTPTTSAQTITPTAPINGFTEVNVSAVTSAIDANIVAGNIKKDVSILGVTGSYEGAAPTGTKQITTNGTHDVAGYANADVQVPTTAPEIYRAFRINNGKLENSESTPFIPLPNTVTDIGDFYLYRCYRNTPSNILSGAIDLSHLTKLTAIRSCESMFEKCTGITSADLSSVATISGERACYYMFSECTNMTSLNLSSLKTISGLSSFTGIAQRCSALTSIDLSLLTTISGASCCQYSFANCSSLASVDMSLLTTISSANYALNGMFSDCTALTSMNFYSLKTATSVNCLTTLFSGCSSLANVYFPALTSTSLATSTFNNLLQYVTGCTLHFPSNLDPQGGSTVISSLSTYPNFGGTNTVLAFDLPATNHLIGADTVEYERSPKFDTGTALAWRVNNTDVNTTTYYTSGTSNPGVGDTIYSDAACTTSVTTVSSIA